MRYSCVIIALSKMALFISGFLYIFAFSVLPVFLVLNQHIKICVSMLHNVAMYFLNIILFPFLQSPPLSFLCRLNIHCKSNRTP